MVWFNPTWGVGEYNYQDMLSDGTVQNGTIVVKEDVHVENSTAPAIGSSFGTFEDRDADTEDDEANDADDARRLLLLIGGGSDLVRSLCSLFCCVVRLEDRLLEGSQRVHNVFR